jgi:thiol:disulfide interchange protein
VSALSIGSERHPMHAAEERPVSPRGRPGLSRRRFIAAACALLAPLGAAAVTATSPLPTRFDPARDPQQDLDTALRMARATHRRVLAEVGGEWCTWCHIMDRFFAANPDLRKLRDANFVMLKVNYSKENGNQAFLARWPKAAGYPHFYVLDAGGRLLQSQDTSALEAAKDYDPIAFRTFLLEWSPR